MKKQVFVVSSIPNMKANLLRAFEGAHLHKSVDLHFAEGAKEAESIRKVITEKEDLLKQCSVVLAEPNQIAHLYSQEYPINSIKWVQSTWAGVNSLFFPDPKEPTNRISFPKDLMLTRMGGTFGGAMAEYCLGAIINIERSSFLYKELQAKEDWKPKNYRRLSDLRIGILGVGDIGSEIARVMKTSFNMKILGCRRTKEDVKHVDEMFTLDQLPSFLGSVDYLINTLPSTKDTYQLLSGNVLSSCYKSSSSSDEDYRGTAFINVGRGTVIDEDSILTALNNGWISNAVLDVFEVEPLPKDSPLWRHPRVTITPHVSAISLPDEVAALFVKNLQRYVELEPLLYVVDQEKGY